MTKKFPQPIPNNPIQSRKNKNVIEKNSPWQWIKRQCPGLGCLAYPCLPSRTHETKLLWLTECYQYLVAELLLKEISEQKSEQEVISGQYSSQKKLFISDLSTYMGMNEKMTIGCILSFSLNLASQEHVCSTVRGTAVCDKVPAVCLFNGVSSLFKL